jgi:hypothetical protein
MKVARASASPSRPNVDADLFRDRTGAGLLKSATTGLDRCVHVRAMKAPASTRRNLHRRVVIRRSGRGGRDDVVRDRIFLRG